MVLRLCRDRSDNEIKIVHLLIIVFSKEIRGFIIISFFKFSFQNDRFEKSMKQRGSKKRLTETKLPEVSTADFLADPEVRADHEHAGRRGDAVPGRVHVRPGGIPAAPGGPFGDLLLPLGVARPELLVAAVLSAVPFLHLVPAVVIHGCGSQLSTFAMHDSILTRWRGSNTQSHDFSLHLASCRRRR